jgi:hypothetical protein
MYLYKTTDFGETWKSITDGIPKSEGTLHVIREHPRNRDLLFAGGEFGLYISFDRGDHWQEFKNNLPRVPVDDIQIHPRENDLILATHGRSIWILDSISPLEQMNARTLASPLQVFNIHPAILWKMHTRRAFDSHDVFEGTNPPYGAIIDFWAKSKPDAKDVKIAILDSAGKQIATIKPATFNAGANRVIWDLRYDRSAPADPRDLAQAINFVALAGPRPNMGPPDRGPVVDPGEYTVEVSIGGNKSTQKFSVEEDPRVTWFSASDRAKRRASLDELMEMTSQADTLRKNFAATDSSLSALETMWKRPEAFKVPENIRKMAESLKKSIDDLRPIFAGRGLGGPPVSPEERQAMLSRPEPDFVLQPLATRVTQLTDELQSFSAAPSKSELDQIAVVKQAIAEARQKLTALGQEVTKLNDAMNAAKVPFVPVP